MVSRIFKERLGKLLLKALGFFEKFWLLLADASELTIDGDDLSQEEGLKISLLLGFPLVLASDLVVHLVNQIVYILLALSVLIFIGLHFVLALLEFSLLLAYCSSYLLNFTNHMGYRVQIVVIRVFGFSLCPEEQGLEIIDALGEVWQQSTVVEVHLCSMFLENHCELFRASAFEELLVYACDGRFTFVVGNGNFHIEQDCVLEVFDC